MEYHLYLESGPKRKTTMVHVLDLLGCFARDGTTELALEATSGAIAAYLTFIERHGETAMPAPRSMDLKLVEHITSGALLGIGSPSILFPLDREPLTVDDGEKHLRWLDWAREELLALVGQLSEEELTAAYPGGRSIKEILQHIWQVEQWYLKNLGGLEKVKRTGNVFEKLAVVRAAIRHRFRNLSGEERSKVFLAPGPFGPPEGDPWTARKSLRRCLEHQWEHLDEVATRLEANAGRQSEP